MEKLSETAKAELRQAVEMLLKQSPPGERAMTPLEIARAWWSVKDEWIVRRNKMHDKKQWEVVHDWGHNLVSDDTQKVVSRHETQEAAELKAERLEDAARGAAVLDRVGGTSNAT